MNMASKMTSTYFTTKNLKHTVLGDDGEAIRVGMGLNNVDSIQILLIFNEEGTNVALRTDGLCKFPEAKKPAMYKLCSQMNAKFRWMKFYVKEEENTIAVEDDAVIQLDSVGAECFELIMRMCGIVDDSYNDFMAEIYAR